MSLRTHGAPSVSNLGTFSLASAFDASMMILKKAAAGHLGALFPISTTSDASMRPYKDNDDGLARY